MSVILMSKLFCILTISVLFSACSKCLDVPDRLVQNKVNIGTNDKPGKGSSDQVANYKQGISASDLQTEAIVSKICVEAWRKGLAGDVDGAMKQLKDLDKKYPKVATVRLMMGQVLERAGRKQEAVQYYKDAVTDFEFSSIHLYKLAEAMRTTGDAKGSIPYYRKLVKNAPDFSVGELGLAKALIQVDSHSTEAKDLIKKVLKAEPANKEALAMTAIKSTKMSK